MAHVMETGEGTGAKAQNTEWFATDLTSTSTSSEAAKYRIAVSVSAAVVVEVTLDSGTTWMSLNANVALTADALYVFEVPIRNVDNFNMRTPTVGGATIRICRISSVTGEG